MPETQAFISFVGDKPETDLVYGLAIRTLADAFGQAAVRDLGDPYAAWDRVRIDERPKSDYCPESRFHLRWAFFIEYLRQIELGKVSVARRAGFDAVAAAQVYAKAEGILEDHDRLVERHIRRVGLMPPFYVVTEQISPWLASQLAAYFAEGTGQHYLPLPHAWSPEEKADRVVGIAQALLDGVPPSDVWRHV